MKPIFVATSCTAVTLLSLVTGCAPAGDQPTPSVNEARAMLKLVERTDELVELIDAPGSPFRRAGDEPLTPDQRQVALPQWATLIDHDLAFESFQQPYLFGWQRAKGGGRARSLVVGLAAHAAQLRARLTLLMRSRNSDALRAALNEASPEYGVPAGHFDRLAIATATPQALLLLQIGLGMLEDQRDALEEAVAEAQRAAADEDAPATTDEESTEVESGGRGNGKPQDFLDLFDRTVAEIEETIDLYDRWGSTLILEAIFLMIDNEFSGIVDPLTKDIALWLGDTRVRQGGQSLISEAQLDELQTRLLPGDILLERRNWYLSNLGLPGFWPHAELYVGTPAEVAAAGAGHPEVRDVFPDGLAAHLAQAHPAAEAAWRTPAEDGEPPRIIEAISEGVVFSSLYEAALADYIGVLRPRRTPLEKARALARAFSHHGKPYDFDFDFLTQSELVCSELVWTSYQSPRDEGRSLELELSEVVGRLTLPPNDIIAQWDRERGTAEQQLEFVAFLDGVQADGQAYLRDEETLAASWRRPKWDLYQP